MVGLVYVYGAFKSLTGECDTDWEAMVPDLDRSILIWVRACPLDLNDFRIGVPLMYTAALKKVSSLSNLVHLAPNLIALNSGY